MIPLIELSSTYLELKDEIDAAVQRVLSSGWYILGPEVEAFERQFADYCGVRHCVGVANGLDALILCLRILDIGRGDEVLVPSNTYIASWLAVSAVGAKPVPVEPDPATHCIDPRLIEAAITSRTKAIMPVHLYGHPADMETIVRIANKHDLYIVEDAAQAHGAMIGKSPLGGHGDAVAWSFYPTKNLGAFGDGGAITVNDPHLAERAATLRNYGMVRKNVFSERGLNSRLDPLQAAILAAKLPLLDEWRERRAGIAEIYQKGLSDLPIALPATAPGATHGWHLYVIRCPDRAAVEKALADAGVQTAVHYPIPPHLQGAYADLGIEADACPIATRLANEVLSLPMSPHLSKADAETTVSAIRRVFGRSA